MIFTDLRFLALLAVAWICFAVARRSWRPVILAVWGIAFYALYAQLFVLVVLALTLIVLIAEGRTLAVATGAIVVGLLVYFKLRTDVVDVMPGIGFSSALVPLGLSYLTFELLHVLIDRRRGRIATLSLCELLAFAFFAPARIAGPIRRYPDFSRAVREATVSSEHVYAGLVRVLIGLAKKFFLADVLRLTVTSEIGTVASRGHALRVILAFTVQIYLDFSAYSDMAIGFARMFGIVLPENFRYPYAASNIREFWDRWHITLSHWVRDYIFLPTGSRLFRTRLRSAPAVIAVISYLLTFFIVGAWHGLTLAFIAWGLYHGVLLSLYHLIRAGMPASIAGHPLYDSRAARAAGVAVTFMCVAFGWIPFMTNWAGASRLLRVMIGSGR